MATLKPGKRLLGRYEVRAAHGAGASGLVYEAADLETGRSVAIKAIRLDPRDPAFRLRIEREIKVLSSLSHPHIVEYLGSGSDGPGQLFLVMEWLAGRDLAKEAGRRPLGEVLEIGRQVASALSVAHQAGVVHRDVKPPNVFLVAGARVDVRVLDFGVAKAEGELGVTRAGAILGTPNYMAPEQALTPNLVDGRADVFSLAVVLYELALGRLPWTTTSELARLARIRTEQPLDPLAVRPDLPPELAAFLRSALAANLDERLASMAELLRELERLQRTLPPAALGRRFDHRAPVAVPSLEIEDTPTEASLPSEAALRAPRARHTSAVWTTRPAGGPSPPPIPARRPSSLPRLAPEARPAGPPEPPLEPRLSHLDPRPAIGREALVRDLTAEVTRSLARRRGGAAQIVGGAGQGKSHVLRALAASLTRAGVPKVLHLRAVEAERVMPHAALARLALLAVDVAIDQVGPEAGFGAEPPTIELGRAAVPRLGELEDRPSVVALLSEAFDLRTEPADVAQRPPIAAAELSAVSSTIPTLTRGEELSSSPTVRGPGPTALHPHVQLFAELAEAGVVLLVDDAHWLDPESTAILAGLARLASPIALVLAAPEALPEAPAGPVFALAALDDVNARRLASWLLRERGRPDAIEVLVQRSAGNPLQLEQLVGATFEAGVLGEAEGRLALVGLVGDASDLERIPRTAADSVRSRLALRPPAVAEVLAAAAVFGESFWLEGVAEALRRHEAEIARTLAELSDAGLVRPCERSRYRSATEFEFVHGLIRTIAVSRLRRPDREALERAAFGFFSSRGETSEAVLAQHAAAAGRRDDAVRLLERAIARSAAFGGGTEGLIELAQRIAEPGGRA